MLFVVLQVVVGVDFVIDQSQSDSKFMLVIGLVHASGIKYDSHCTLLLLFRFLVELQEIDEVLLIFLWE